MPKDWFEWHDLYNSEPTLQQRLQIVREYISHSLDASLPGIIRVVSVCVGDGRDLFGNAIKALLCKRCVRTTC
ncbi:MAG: hypothetical protein RM049_28150 [Nostoc sp. DedQUE04]|uniref:hypothetical protein n=1 Tax=Nostoc sp. DedQUE04 TaxID=3075390 RepID=UPI002AD3F3F7|nr:hypothetical protein [Nostoc sp. DedQUE04]MDZ8139109.1 hypothetical protein [Nostoc sp. DedQUE04]